MGGNIIYRESRNYTKKKNSCRHKGCSLQQRWCITCDTWKKNRHVIPEKEIKTHGCSWWFLGSKLLPNWNKHTVNNWTCVIYKAGQSLERQRGQKEVVAWGPSKDTLSKWRGLWSLTFRFQRSLPKLHLGQQPLEASTDIEKPLKLSLWTHVCLSSQIFNYTQNRDTCKD